MRPAYITATRSQVSAITPMSCVISITAAPRSRQMRLSSWMICAWIDTSSAVVGSSATMSLGSAASASAITTRCRMPPENWCGKWSMRLLGGGNAGVLSRPMARLRASDSVHGQVGADGLDQLPADGVERVERGQRVLEDRADLAAADPAHRIETEVVDALAFEQDLAAGHAARRLEQADDGRARERLAGAGFAHHAEDFALARCRRKCRRAHAACRGGWEFDDEVLDLEQRHGGVLLFFSAGAGSARRAASRRAGSR
jgi:hypothetical protein